jgi:hypothetical protein
VTGAIQEELAGDYMPRMSQRIGRRACAHRFFGALKRSFPRMNAGAEKRWLGRRLVQKQRRTPAPGRLRISKNARLKSEAAAKNANQNQRLPR